MEEMAGGGRHRDYYALLGLRRNSSLADVRTAYRKLALKWHPDRWAGRARKEAAEEAKRRFQQIQEAYQVLSDERKRALYDVGLYSPEEEEEEEDDDDDDDEGLTAFVQEMVTLMADVSREGKVYSPEELQRMLVDMAGGFDAQAGSTPQRWAPDQWETCWDDNSKFPKRRRCDVAGREEPQRVHVPAGGAGLFHRQRTAY